MKVVDLILDVPFGWFLLCIMILGLAAIFGG